MAIPDLEQALSALNLWRLTFLYIGAVAVVLTTIATFGTVIVQLKYNRTDAQLRAERASENLRQREKVAAIENDTAKAMLLLAWRRLNPDQLHTIAEGLREAKIERLQVAALAGDPEATQFGTDILTAARDAGYEIPRLGQIVSSSPYFGLKVSGPTEYVARIASLFAKAGFPDVERQVTGPGPLTISVGAKPPPRSN